MIITDTTVQFTRGIIQYEQMEAYIVPVLDNPFEDAFDVLYEKRADLNSSMDEVEYRYFPTTALNDFLRFWVPTLAHPFYKDYSQLSRILPRSGYTLHPMTAIGIPRLADGENATEVPISEHWLKQIVKFWIEEAVAVDYFSAEELETEGVQTALTEAKDAIDKADVQWDFVNLRTLWEARHNRDIGYRALQTLLAVQFVINGKAQNTQVGDDLVEWRLAQENRHLIPVSQRFIHTKTSDHYAYTLEIELRDMPGRDQMLVYLMPRLRRYMPKVTWDNQTTVRIMVEFQTPLVEELPLNQLNIQVALRVIWNKRLKSRVYSGYVTGMLEKLAGKGNAVVDPDVLYQNAEPYMEPNPNAYHVIYDTGRKPAPKMHPGLPQEHLKAIHAAVRNNLEDWVLMDVPLRITSNLTVVDEMVNDEEWFALMTLDEIKAKGAWLGKKLSKKRAEMRDRWAELIHERFQTALRGKPFVIVLVADNPRALQAMEFDVRSILALSSMDDDLPDGFEIQHVMVAPVLTNRPDDSKPKTVKADASAISKWIRDAEQSGLRLDKNKAYVAVVQRPEAAKKSEEKKQDDAKKKALRIGFSTNDIRTQMIRRFPDDPEHGLQIRKPAKGRPPHKEHRSRLMRAVSDALIAGTGFTYDSPADLYTDLLGFESDFAKQIVVEYWVRHRITNPKIDYIGVARQYADTGYIEVIFPEPESGEPLNPMSVHDAYLYVQQLFTNTNPKKRDKKRVYTMYENTNVPDDRVFTFFGRMLELKRTQPTLLIPQVGDWRSGQTTWFDDKQFGGNHQTVSVGEYVLSRNESPYVRVVKMLTDESYNMRYWLHNEQVEQSDALLALKDTQCAIPTIYSIDMRKTTKSDELDLEVEHKRGRVVEFASVLSQTEDTDLYAWCAIPHLARVHPGWGHAKTIYPYPYHLVRKMIQDATDVIV